MLLAPSVAPKIKTELASPSLTHVHKPSNDSTSSTLMDRVQLVNVSSPQISVGEGNTIDTALMAQEGQDYAKYLPEYIKWLFGKGDVPASTDTNRFEQIRPAFILYDVRNTL